MNRVTKLYSMTVGERHYVETTKDTFAKEMNLWSPHQKRLHRNHREKKWSVTFYTGIGTKIGDVRYLLCIERTH